jgi:IS30 family transposase
MDTIVSGTGTSQACLLVLTERMTRRVIVRKLPARTQAAVIRELDRLERSGHFLFNGLKTITCDNGCEFLDFRAIEKSATHAGRRCEVFFAHPFRASERGSNENANRIVRRFVPKGADISAFPGLRSRASRTGSTRCPAKIFDGLSAEEKVKRYFEECRMRIIAPLFRLRAINLASQGKIKKCGLRYSINVLYSKVLLTEGYLSGST